MSIMRKGPSPKLLIALFVLGIGLLFYGEYYYSSGRSVYGISGNLAPTLAGLAILLIDGVLIVIWRALRDRPTALEEELHGDDPDA
jgi:hypothetical protein